MYEIQIKKLRFLINNWEAVKIDSKHVIEKFSEIFGEKLSIDSGLCFNCDLIRLEYDLWEYLFESFPKFSGELDYPLRDFGDYSEIDNYTDTPERLELAIHCLKYLEGLNG